MSNELRQLKLKILKNNDVENILKALDCEIYKYEQTYKEYPLLVAKPPNSRNKRAVQVRLSPSLPAYIRNEGVNGDIFTLIGFFLYGCRNFEETKQHLYQIKQWICNTLNYDFGTNNNVETETKTTDWNKWLRELKRKRSKSVFDYEENKVIDESQLKYFENYPHIKWIEEGISPKTQRLFGVSYDIYSERIVVPIHNKYGELIGTKGRYVGCDNEKEKQKYIYLHRCNKSIELFNYHRALPYIKKHKKVIVVEGFKTVMKLWQWGFKFCVSIEGDQLSPIQAKLLKELGVNVIIFAWDKDKPISFIKSQLQQIKTRDVQFIYDQNNILKDPKASPADEGLEKWLILYKKNRYRLKNK